MRGVVIPRQCASDGLGGALFLDMLAGKAGPQKRAVIGTGMRRGTPVIRINLGCLAAIRSR